MLKLRDNYIKKCQANLMNQILVIISLMFLSFSGISAIKFLRLQMEKINLVGFVLFLGQDATCAI